MLWRDVVGGDVIEVGTCRIHVGERTDYKEREYSLPLTVDGGTRIFLVTGARHPVPGAMVEAAEKKGMCARVGIDAPRHVKIKVIQSARWDKLRGRRRVSA